MPNQLHEAVAESIVRENKDDLLGMSDSERREVVKGILDQVSKKSEDELISFISSKGSNVSPDLVDKINEIQTLKERIQPTPGGEIAFIEQKRQEKAQLQKIGVVTDRDLPAGSIEIGFSPSPEKAIKDALTKHFGAETPVFRRGEDLLYLDPKSKEVVRVEPGMIQNLGLSLPIGGDIAGTITGGALAAGTTKAPPAIVAGEAAGSTVGTATGEFLRLTIGKWMGVHDMSYPEMMKKAGVTGVKAGAGTGAVGALMASAKGAANFLKGNIFTKHDAMLHGLSSKEAEIVLEEVNKLLARKGVKGEIKGTLGRMTDDVATGSKEAELRKVSEFAQRFIERDASDKKMLIEALEAVTGKAKDTSIDAASAVLTKQVAGKVGKAQEIVATNVKDLQTKLANIGRVNKEMVGEPTRAVIIAKSDAAYRAQKNVWEKLKRDFGFKEADQTFGIPIPEGEGTQALSKIMSRRAETATTQGMKRSSSNIFVQQAKEKGEKEAFLLLPDGTKHALKSKPLKKNADLNDFNREISNLKSDIRAAKKGRAFGDPQLNDLNETLTALVEQRRNALMKSGNEKLLKSIEAAEKKTAEFHETFNRSILGDLTKKNENGVFEIKGKEFVNKILKGTPEEANQLIGAIGDKPTLMAMWKEGVADAYKRAAFKDGKFNREASTKFLKSHQDILGKFFDGEMLKKLETAGNLSEKIVKQNEQLKAFIGNASKKWGRGKLMSLDPDKVVDFITNNSGSFIKGKGIHEKGVQVAVKKIRYVKGFMEKNHPAAWKELQDRFTQDIRKNALDAKTKEVSYNNINKILTNQKTEIIEMMGKDYYDDLLKVGEATALVNRSLTKLSDQEVKQGVLAIARAIAAPPLTRRGRMLTAASVFETRWARQKIADALLDKATIKRVAEASEHKRLTRQAAELYISTGLIGED